MRSRLASFRSPRLPGFCGLLLLAAIAAPAQAEATTQVRLARVGGFDSPTYLTSPRGDAQRRFVTERAGTIRIVRGRRKLARPFLDIRSQVSTAGEGGLLSMAFDPGYARNRL